MHSVFMAHGKVLRIRILWKRLKLQFTPIICWPIKRHHSNSTTITHLPRVQLLYSIIFTDGFPLIARRTANEKKRKNSCVKWVLAPPAFNFNFIANITIDGRWKIVSICKIFTCSHEKKGQITEAHKDFKGAKSKKKKLYTCLLYFNPIHFLGHFGSVHIYSIGKLFITSMYHNVVQSIHLPHPPTSMADTQITLLLLCIKYWLIFMSCTFLNNSNKTGINYYYANQVRK